MFFDVDIWQVLKDFDADFDVDILGSKISFDVDILGFKKFKILKLCTMATNLAIFAQMLATFLSEHLGLILPTKNLRSEFFFGKIWKFWRLAHMTK